MRPSEVPSLAVPQHACEHWASQSLHAGKQRTLDGNGSEGNGKRPPFAIRTTGKLCFSFLCGSLCRSWNQNGVSSADTLGTGNETRCGRACPSLELHSTKDMLRVFLRHYCREVTLPVTHHSVFVPALEIKTARGEVACDCGCCHIHVGEHETELVAGPVSVRDKAKPL